MDYHGFEFDVNAHLGDNFDVFFGYGDTDSEIIEFDSPAAIGNQAPLVSQNTTNLGFQYRRSVRDSGLSLFARADYQRLGKT